MNVIASKLRSPAVFMTDKKLKSAVAWAGAAEIERLQVALHSIWLLGKNADSTKEDLLKIAREALEGT